jgi:hypothetical protein
MRLDRAGVALVAGALALFAAGCSPADDAKAPPPAEVETEAEAPKSAEPPVVERTSEAGAPFPADIEPAAGAPAGAPMAPTSTASGDSIPPGYDNAFGSAGSGGGGSGQGAPPPQPVAPPAAANGHSGPSAMPPAAAGDPPPAGAPKNGHGGAKVLSYFQQGRTRIDTARAFGFVLMPKIAVSDGEKRAQKDFCVTVLASMDFMTPGAVAASAPAEVLATFWPVVGSRESFEIKDAFAQRNCDELISWYDHKLARTLALKAGVAELSGPLLITWPSQGLGGDAARDPLIVDFSKANQERAAKALKYWFRQVKARPELWTNRIREGTIRAELADAVNDTAGVMLSVLAGKWDSLTVVASAP